MMSMLSKHRRSVKQLPMKQISVENLYAAIGNNNDDNVTQKSFLVPASTPSFH